LNRHGASSRTGTKAGGWHCGVPASTLGRVIPDLPLSPDDVAEIVSILDKTPYERIDIRTKRFSLAVVRSGKGWTQSWEWAQGSAEPSVGAATADTTTSAAARTDEASVDGLLAIRALLPGSFYRAPEPGAAPFIEVGSSVEPGTVVGIIETMKLMTPVHAGVSGTVVAILVENAAPVDAEAVLIRVKPTDE
jgi:acetyl-CoA carboxylase biotin carboxyl carrier protein